MKHNIDELERHLKGLQKNLYDGYTGGCMLFIYDALTELNVIRRKANGIPTSEKQLAAPDVSNNEVAVCDHKEYRWHKELADNEEECVNCGQIKQTDC